MKNSRAKIETFLIFLGLSLVTQNALPLGAQVLAPTGTFTATPRHTLTPTPSITPTPFGTPTHTFSPTVTATGTQLTYTPTRTATATKTSTATQTSTVTRTMTPTPTSTPGIYKFFVPPKPDGSGQIQFSWGCNVEASETFLRIFTSGFRIVREFDFFKKESPGMLTKGDHQVNWDGKDEEGRPMPPGTYLCFVSITVGKKTYESSGMTNIP
jgi:hypothetical protein